MKKEFLPYDTVRNNALKLAHRIHNDGFIPDVIYVSLRGGAYLGNVISEYFKIVQGDNEPAGRVRKRPVYYAAVVARSYTSVRESAEVRVDGWTYSPDHLRTGDRILLIDDIFDSGNTINHLAKIILKKGVPREDLKIAVHDYKYFVDKENQLPIQPDYWCRKHEESVNGAGSWIHYLSHELIGLKAEEREKEYYRQDAELRDILESIF